MFYAIEFEEPLLETDPTRMCELLVGLPDVNVTAVGDWPGWLRIAITTRAARPVCPRCSGVVHRHGRVEVVLVDLPVFGRPARLVWSKQRWKCPHLDCKVRTWGEIDERIAPARAAITDRAGRWATIQVGRHGRSVAWHQSHVSNGPTEAINNLVKRVKRTAFGMTRFRNYRLRSLLYAGKPNWTLLNPIPR